jgi:hypothetical protein
MKYLDQTEVAKTIRKRLPQARSAIFAVAYWGKDAGKQLGLTKGASGVRIICELSSGGTNPAEIRLLLEAGLDVRQCDDLHAKVYLFDNAVIIGSSNASANGLDFDPQGGLHEANVLLEDPAIVATVRAKIETLPTRTISLADLRRAEVRRRLAQTRPPLLDRLAVALGGDSPDQGVYLVVFTHDMDKDAELEANEIIDSQENEPDLDAFQDWPKLPREGMLVCFRLRNGQLKFDGVCERRADLDSHAKQHSLQFCHGLRGADLRVPPKDIAAWRPLVDRLVASDRWETLRGCGWANLSDLLSAAK